MPDFAQNSTARTVLGTAPNNTGVFEAAGNSDRAGRLRPTPNNAGTGVGVPLATVEPSTVPNPERNAPFNTTTSPLLSNTGGVPGTSRGICPIVVVVVVVVGTTVVVVARTVVDGTAVVVVAFGFFFVVVVISAASTAVVVTATGVNAETTVEVTCPGAILPTANTVVVTATTVVVGATVVVVTAATVVDGATVVGATVVATARTVVVDDAGTVDVTTTGTVEVLAILVVTDETSAELDVLNTVVGEVPGTEPALGTTVVEDNPVTGTTPAVVVATADCAILVDVTTTSPAAASALGVLTKSAPTKAETVQTATGATNRDNDDS